MLRTAAIAIAAAAFSAPASAASPNVTGANVNTFNLLAPFLTLDSTAAGQQLLQLDLSQSVAINQNSPSAALLNGNLSTAALAALAISDENLLGSLSNNVYGLSTATYYGVAANLAGGLPTQNTTSYGTLYNGQQPVGGFGSVLGAAYVTDVGNVAHPGTAITSASQTALPNTVTLLTTALNFIGNTNATLGDASLAKDYFANGTVDGTNAAVAPAGYTLPTADGYPNWNSATKANTSVYDTAYGVSNTQSGQNAYGDSHPYQVAGVNGYPFTLYDPTVKTTETTNSLGLAQDKPSTNPSFPSSHMAYAMTDSILLGMLVPETYQSMLVRASAMGESRVVVGVHYPTDIIASRAMAQFDLANYLSNPAYINNAAVTGTAVNLPSLFTAAEPEITGALTTAAATADCGTSLATCATSAQNNAANPFAPSATNSEVYTARLTYGLPILTFAQAPQEQAPAGAPDASILLATVYGGSTSAAQTLAPNGGIYGALSTNTINQIIVNTETNALAAFYGTSLSYWSRINLDSAIGYFGAVSGTITLASTDQVDENVTVAGAATNVNDPTNPNDMIPAGVLRGFGAITGNVEAQAGGAIAPGSATETTGGQLKVYGNLQFDAGSNFAAQGFLNNGVASTDSLAISAGNLTIANGAQITLSGVYLPGVKYDLITLAAGGTITGDFTSVAFAAGSTQSNLMGFLNPELQYAADPSVSVELEAGFVSAGQTPNQKAVAGAIDAAANAGGLSANGVTLLTELIANNTAATAPAAFNALSGQGLPAQQTVALDAGRLFASTVLDQATLWSGDRSNGAPGQGDKGDLKVDPGHDGVAAGLTRVWETSFDQFDSQNATGGASLNSHDAGFAAGIDHQVDRSLLLGVAGGYSDSSFSGADTATNGTVKGGHFGAYGVERLGAFYLAGTLDYAHFDDTTDRFVSGLGALQEEKGKFSSNQWLARSEGGYKFQSTGVAVTPFAGFQFASLDNGAFAETGVGGSIAGLNVNGQTVNSQRSFAGFQIDKTLTVANDWVLTPFARVSWEHEFDTDRTVTASLQSLPSPYTVSNPSAVADMARINTGLKLDINAKTTVYASFDGEFADHSSSYAGTAGVRVWW